MLIHGVSGRPGPTRFKGVLMRALERIIFFFSPKLQGGEAIRSLSGVPKSLRGLSFPFFLPFYIHSHPPTLYLFDSFFFGRLMRVCSVWYASRWSSTYIYSWRCRPFSSRGFLRWFFVKLIFARELYSLTPLYIIWPRANEISEIGCWRFHKANKRRALSKYTLNGLIIILETKYNRCTYTIEKHIYYDILTRKIGHQTYGIKCIKAGRKTETFGCGKARRDNEILMRHDTPPFVTFYRNPKLKCQWFFTVSILSELWPLPKPHKSDWMFARKHEAQPCPSGIPDDVK